MSYQEPEIAGQSFAQSLTRRLLNLGQPADQPMSYHQLVALYKAADDAHAWPVHETQAWAREQTGKPCITDITSTEATDLTRRLRAQATATR